MNINLKLKKAVLLSVILTIIVSFISPIVYAGIDALIDESRRVTLNIVNKEYVNGSSEATEIDGAEFTIYLVEDNIREVNEAEEYIISQSEITKYSGKTENGGKLSFQNIEQGRYFIMQTGYPKNAISGAESFLIDLPRTSSSGNSWEYEVTVYPKNISLYGTVVFNEVDKSENVIEGNIWKLKKIDDNGIWQDYDNEEYLSNKNYDIEISNLEVGKYKFVKEYSEDGYIADAKNTQSSPEFEINAENLNLTIRAVSENVNVEKSVLLENGDDGKYLGVFKGSKPSWKTVATIPSTIADMDIYTVVDEIGGNMKLVEGTIKVYGIDNNGEEFELTDDCYEVENIVNVVFKFKFVPEKIKEYSKIVIKYDTFVTDNADHEETMTRAYAEYTNYINLEGICTNVYTGNYSYATVYTGGVVIKKVDSSNNPIINAQFKIATSKENAQNGVFVKNIIGEDLVAISNSEGYVVFNGLKYGGDDEIPESASSKYWIVETYAPSDYRLSNEIKEVTVSRESYNNYENAEKMVNWKKYELPMTGGTGSIISLILGVLLIIISIFIIKKKNNKEKSLKVEKS